MFDKENMAITVMYMVISVMCVVTVFAWLTHVFMSFATEAWGFLIAGALFFPLGILHGFYLWFV